MGLREFFAKEQFRATFIIMLALIVLIVCSKLFVAKGPTKSMSRWMKRLMSEATNAHTMASNTTNPLMQLVHANSALSYVHALRTLIPDDVLNNTSRININDMTDTLESHYNEALRVVATTCPALKPNGSYSTGNRWN